MNQQLDGEASLFLRQKRTAKRRDGPSTAEVVVSVCGRKHPFCMDFVLQNALIWPQMTSVRPQSDTKTKVFLKIVKNRPKMAVSIEIR
jgi:hypothetical protein